MLTLDDLIIDCDRVESIFDIERIIAELPGAMYHWAQRAENSDRQPPRYDYFTERLSLAIAKLAERQAAETVRALEIRQADLLDQLGKLEGQLASGADPASGQGEFSAQRLREARVASGKTQLQLALEVGVHGGVTVSQWERGVHTPKGKMLDRLRAVLPGAFAST